MRIRGLVLPDVFGYALSRLVPAAFSMMAVIVLSRMMGATEYGYLSLIVAAANTASVIASGWLTQSLLRYTSGRSAADPRIQQIIRQGFLVASGIGAAVVVPGISYAWQGSIGLPGLVVAAALSCALSAHAVLLSMLQTTLQVRGFALIEILRSFGALVFAPLLMLLLATSHVVAAGGNVLALICSSCAGILLLRMPNSKGGTAAAPSPIPDNVSLISFVRFGTPLSAWLGLSIAFPFCERVLIQRFAGPESLGIYAALYDVVFRGASLFSMPIVMALHPRIMAFARAGDEVQATELMRRGVILQLLVAVGLLALLSGVSPWILKVTLGHAAASAPGLVIPFGIASSIWCIALLVHKPLEIAGRTGLMTVVLGAALGAALVVDVLAIPVFGPVAAAYASIGAGVVYCGIVVVTTRYLAHSRTLAERATDVRQ